MHCFSCNAACTIASGERVGFHASCDGCRADLHVCRNCHHHDSGAYNGCREPSAERVSDPERGNRCEYFRPGEGRVGDGVEQRAGALADLDALFKR